MLRDEDVVMRALIVVDLQNDFVPGGALAVREGDLVVPVVNRLMDQFELVVATQDWHPDDHGSFAASHSGKKPGDVIELAGLRQILWPVHCVQNTAGAEFVAGLKRERIERVFQKGVDPHIDSYSGFFDNGHKRGTGLAEYLESRQVDRVYIAGIATDYCVKFTALDARQLGLETVLVVDACRGVDVQAGDSARAVDEMRAAGVKILTSQQVGPE
ncbi:MAG TPA: bifunctional nicotinamidase/pyrazinamidase [Tepidisphaeraceae bacterium]|jgi:nicotinamidase/pyrazinamidase